MIATETLCLACFLSHLTDSGVLNEHEKSTDQVTDPILRKRSVRDLEAVKISLPSPFRIPGD